MNWTRKLLTAAAVLALSGGGLAVTSPAGGAAVSTAPAAEATNELKVTRLSKLDGLNIYGSDSKKIGEVEDLVVDPATGKVLHALVSIGGVLGVGGKGYAVPIKQLRVFSRSAEDTLPVKVELTEPAESLPLAKQLDKDSSYVMGTRLLGTDIDDSAGKEAGEIEDLVVDLRAGEASFALVEFDDSWGVKDRLFAFPLAEIKRDPDSKKVSVAVTKESLVQRPSIEKSRLDKMDLGDSSWIPMAGGTGASGTTGASSTGAPAPAN